MSKITVVAAGSPDWGLGHLKRSTEIIRLLKAKGHAVDAVALIPSDADQKALKLSLASYDRVIHAWDELKDFSVQGYVADLPMGLQKEFLAFAKANIKSPVAALEWYESKDQVIVDSIDLRGGGDALKFAIVRREILDQAARKSAEKSYNAIVMLGGRDHRGYRRKISDVFRHDQRLSGRTMAVILGPMDDELSAAEQNIPGVDVYKNPANLPELMAGARVGLSNAGTSLMEFCALGIPTIVFSQTDEEEKFSRIFFMHGCSVQGSLDPQRFFSQLNELWSDRDLYHRRSGQARELIDGQGAQRTADRIEKALGIL